MKPTFRIDPAAPSDAPHILDLIQELADYEKLGHEVVATAEDVRRELFDPGARIEAVVAREGDRVVGFALYFHNFSTFLGRRGIYLEDLYVRPEFRGRGYGKALLIHLARTARDRECGRLEWSVLDWNRPAIEFYESLDAVAMDGWTVYRLTGPALQRLAESGASQ